MSITKIFFFRLPCYKFKVMLYSLDKRDMSLVSSECNIMLVLTKEFDQNKKKTKRVYIQFYKLV